MLAINVEELSFVLNSQVLAKKDVKLEVRPQISGSVVRDPNNEKLWTAGIMVRVISDEKALSPFNLTVRARGIFEADGLQDEADRRDLAFNMVEVVYPHVRAAVASLTANAYVRPLMLPIVSAENLFPPHAIFSETGVVIPAPEATKENLS